SVGGREGVDKTSLCDREGPIWGADAFTREGVSLEPCSGKAVCSSMGPRRLADSGSRILLRILQDEAQFRLLKAFEGALEARELGRLETFRIARDEDDRFPPHVVRLPVLAESQSLA